MARPRTYNAEDITKALNKYIDETEDPLIQEFVLNYGISIDQLYDIAKRDEEDSKELSLTIKKAIQKQEVFLVRNVSTRKVSEAFGIFRLKQPQHGWTDKQEVAIDAKVVNFEGSDKLPK